MNWYARYLPLFEKDYDSIPDSLIQQVKQSLKAVHSDNPLVSVVAIAHNEERRILACLWSLAENKVDFPIEILVVNDASTDRTAEVLDRVGAYWVYEEKKSPGYARQRGEDVAKGKYLICIDSDTIYPPDYIRLMTMELERPGVVGVTGLWSYVPDKDHGRFALSFYEMLRDINLSLIWVKRPEQVVRGMVFGYNLEAGRKAPYRVQIRRGEDGAKANDLKLYGKLFFLKDRRARVFTSTSTIRADGSIWKSLWVRIAKSFRRFRTYFKGEKEYKDQESNMMK